LKTHAYDAGFHVGVSHSNPEVVAIRFFEQPGITLTPALQKEIEKSFTRQELRRAGFDEVGQVSYPARVRESYAQDLLSQLDADAIRRRGFRIVVDYSYSAASYVMPLLFGPLGVEAVTAHGIASERSTGGSELHESIGEAKRLVSAIGGELGVVLDRAGERLWLIDERGREIAVEKTLLLFLRLLRETVREGKAVFPVTVTRLVDEILEGSGLEVVRTQNSLAALTAAAAEEGVVFAGALSGGYVFPEFLPAYDAVASLCKLLELLAPLDRPLSELVADLPASTLVHRQLPCPWALKGLIMRVLNERLAGRELDLTDGIKLFDERGWVQVLPDPDEPVIHLYAEGDTDELSNELEHELREQVEEIMQGEEASVRA
jgi:mannose-1-phosphate guanylyltransferase/phosphomannomutase